jgi:peptidoglycan/xylan/chitin deacetylase (PgdA/CDA1 family)
MKKLGLLYHDVIMPGDYKSSGFQSPDANIYKLDRAEFERHLTAIAARTKHDVCLVTEARSLPGTQILLTFDDGGASANSCIADMIEARGWRGHFFVTTDYISRPGFLSPSEIRALRKRGHIIGSHSCSHPPRMARCTPAEMDREWRESAARLTDILGEPVEVASVPGGYFSREVARSAALAGIRVLFNSEPVMRSQTVDGCLVLGRYGVQRGVSAEWAAAVASGADLPRLRSYLFWNTKKALKRVGGEYWLDFRKRFLAKRAGAL